MVSCLQLGAADYMLKPLRHNELRNLWARVYWWRRVCLVLNSLLHDSGLGNGAGIDKLHIIFLLQASYLQQQPAGSVSLPAPVSQGSVGSDNTKWLVSDLAHAFVGLSSLRPWNNTTVYLLQLQR